MSGRTMTSSWSPRQLITSGVRLESFLAGRTYRERVFESAFWTLATRDTGLRSGFVTADLDDELAECGGNGKNRQIIETYFDRAYSTNPATRFCPQVRPFSDAPADLLRWQRDVVAQPLTEPLDYKSGSWAPALSMANWQ